MYNKFDGILAILAVFILVHLSGVYTSANYISTETGVDVEKTQEEEAFLDDETKNDLKLKLQATKDNWTADDEEYYVTVRREQEAKEEEERRREEQFAREERAAGEEHIAQEKAEEERQIAISDDNRRLSERMIGDLKQVVAGDPYNSERYIDVRINSETHHVVVRVDENTFASLNLDLKKTTYEYASQEIQQFYLGYLDEYPDEIIVELEDSRGQNLSTYRHDIIGDRYVLEMNHTNDSNF